ncbi:MAG: Polyribonucleotide nucleotidyltransferase [Candidatus Beckwithbacteria bacterium GW2011_GWA2_43_10]|uniref:Polyribonucleotide nucleotidyltransferase n=1 Tax=Candidatus Beckwithbacteria bacterium GW2011_GWA2_43_10 TaxID=1618369 RepID=A0A0G1C2Z1_9BACT|nr:MAG: Polyribonucleotide nucleotidyltransferase [Candidatus Beckwithbacteria bacterium GW2011_GWA2_43_10]
MGIKSKTVVVNGQTITFESGRYAEQATAAVLVKANDTVVLVTVVAGQENPNLGYFPLSVEYQEKLYASGIIKGSRWVKREGKPTDEAILKARLIDRSIRPLFPKGYLKEVQVIAQVLSYDQTTDPDVLALCAASAALSLSPIPWNGPIAAVRVKNDNLDLVVSGSKDALVMVEAGANQVSETDILEALASGHAEIKKIIGVINELIKEAGSPKEELIIKPVEAALAKQVLAKTKTALDDLIVRLQTSAREKDLNLGPIQAACLEDMPEADSSEVKAIIDDYFKTALRQKTVTKKIRTDGRGFDQIRPITCEVGVLPRTHGSAMFKRGSTQALTIVTLGSPRLEQLIEDLEGETSKRYIHHYNFPPFSVGEAGRMGWPSRREIGHGALAERAIEPVLPEAADFPYTMRVVSEIMSSNGSTSMASVCGSTLSLMDAGVPLKKPVAGIAMGLMVEGKDYVVLTDIQGAEDHLGDMDFKVAGTDSGITALQMDIKIPGVTPEILKDALEKAKQARLSILDIMIKTIVQPRAQVSAYAPKIATLNIPVEKIGELIGPGGKTIKKIIQETGCEVDVDDNGRVIITGVDPEKLAAAKKWVNGLTREIKVGEEFDAKIVRIEPFGVFVELLPGRDGLVHVSRLSTGYVADPNTIVKIGQTLHVRVREIDEFRRPGGGQRYSGRR